jgi:hypothetical protein
MSALRKEIVEAQSESIDSLADEIIAYYNGDARAAVKELAAIVRHLATEVARLRISTSRGYARMGQPAKMTEDHTDPRPLVREGQNDVEGH